MWGNVLRGAWFYQRARANLWFHAIRTAIARAVAHPAVAWVDLGPSTTDAIAAAKERLGFADTADWRTHCRYDGPFAHDELLLKAKTA